MADTEPRDEGAQTDEPGKKPEPEAKGEDIRIPKARLDQEAAKRKAAEERAAAAEARIKELEESKKPEKTEPKPKEIDSTVLERLQAIEERDAIRDLRTEMSLNTDQATAVRQVQKDNPGLKMQEALAIARSRDLELFGNVDGRGVDPSQHTTVRPRGGGPPQKQSMKDRVGEIKKIESGYVRNREAARLHGQKVAEVLGWERKESE